MAHHVDSRYNLPHSVPFKEHFTSSFNAREDGIWTNFILKSMLACAAPSFYSSMMCATLFYSFFHPHTYTLCICQRDYLTLDEFNCSNLQVKWGWIQFSIFVYTFIVLSRWFFILCGDADVVSKNGFRNRLLKYSMLSVEISSK